jgi:hypothetical protein
LVLLLLLQTPDPPAQRPQLEKVIALIDEVNAQDPTKVPVDGGSAPYRSAASAAYAEIWERGFAGRALHAHEQLRCQQQK